MENQINKLDASKALAEGFVCWLEHFINVTKANERTSRGWHLFSKVLDINAVYIQTHLKTPINPH